MSAARILAAEQSAPSVFASVEREIGALICESIVGRITAVAGFTATAAGVPAPVGARCRILTRRDGALDAEVVALRGAETVLSVFGEVTGVAPGDRVACQGGVPRVAVGFDLLGRVIDAEGNSLDDRPAPRMNVRYPLYSEAPPAMHRAPVDKPLGLGVRVLDGLLTAGRGQRLGILASAGVGKSVLMGMICRYTQADVNVVALVGERGREVREFVERQLDAEGLKRTVVVVATSDQAPTLRVRAALQATAYAEFFRDRGLNVLLMMDSLTRVAMAQRQLGLAAGEPPTARGYPPSVFALLPRLLERAGNSAAGSITGIYTVLTDADEVGDPIAEAARGILDGHIALSRSLAGRGHYPAVDVLGSISRVADDVMDAAQRIAAQRIRRVIATWKDIEDLVNIGAYAPGANEDYDLAYHARGLVDEFVRQDRTASSTFDDNVLAAKSLAEHLESLARRISRSRGGEPAQAKEA